MFDNHNDIEFPVKLRMMQRYGNPTTLNFYFDFVDQTAGEDGVCFEWERRGDTLWVSFQEEKGDVSPNERYLNTRSVEMGGLDSANYLLMVKCQDENGESGLLADTVRFEVTDSSYHLEEMEGKAVRTKLDDYESQYESRDYRRLFPDMLLVEIAEDTTKPSYVDSFFIDLAELGAEACTVSAGNYSMFVIADDGQIYIPLYNGNLMWGEKHLFTYSGDTCNLRALGEQYSNNLRGLWLRMGNGFRYGFGWMVIE